MPETSPIELNSNCDSERKVILEEKNRVQFRFKERKGSSVYIKEHEKLDRLITASKIQVVCYIIF